MPAMIKILDDSEQIEAAFRFLEERFMASPHMTVPVVIPYYPNDLAMDVRWFPDHRFWVCLDPDGRFMLGVSEKPPERNQKVTVTLEMGFPDEGIYRYVHGALAEDEFRNLLLVYRGGFGGGNRGVGRKAFLQKFGGKILTVTDGDRQTDVAFFAALGSTHFLDQVGFFLREVQMMREEFI
jgi:hypothetical protein